MQRVNKIWNHPEYRQYLTHLQEAEKDREFCRHTPEHFLDVARLTVIFAAEEGICLSKELIYAAALLHDIGRILQYENQTPHDQASVQIAGRLLPVCDFEQEEIEQILDAIAHHRDASSSSPLARLLYRADKVSRLCFLCPARDACNWSDEKKNLEITY